MANTSNTPPASKTTYGILTAVIVGLVLLIGWFIFLLVKPDSEEPTNTNNTNTVNVFTTNSNSNLNANANSANINENTNTNDADENTNENDDTDATEEDDGLVQPDDSDQSNDEAGEEITLYFPKSASSCGEVYAVTRKQELSDDKYGDIILAAMAGPDSDEAGYVDGVPSSVRLRQVEYTADGALITVGEGYNELSDCQKQTVDAQLVKTANAMFDLPEGTSGKVEVGTIEAEVEAEAEEDESEE